MTGSRGRAICLTLTIGFALTGVLFSWLFWVFYLRCATWFGFNSEGRCFDDVEQVVYHSQSLILGGIALLACALTGLSFWGYKRFSP